MTRPRLGTSMTDLWSLSKSAKASLKFSTISIEYAMAKSGERERERERKRREVKQEPN